MKQLFRYISVVVMLFTSMAVSAQSTIKVMTITNGTVTTDKNSASKNETVTITVTPSEGYYFQKENLEVVKTVNPASTRGDVPIAGPIVVSGSDPADLSVARSYTFTVPDDGYVFQVSATFTARSAITDGMVSLSATNFTYNGSDQKPTVSVTGLTEGTDYTVSFAESAWKEVGTYSVNVSGKSTYKGTVTKTWTITAPETPSVVNTDESVTVDGHELYEPSKEVTEAIKEAIETDIALPQKAEGRVEVTEGGGLKFSKGEDLLVGLLDMKLRDIVKFIFTGRLFGDSSKLRLKNASTRGTRAAGDMELISEAEYEVIEAGDQVVTVKLEEGEATVETIAITESEKTPITIGKSGKASYCGDKSLDFSFSDEVKAYIATGFDKDEGTIWLTRVKDVPAGVPVLIKLRMCRQVCLY